MSLSTPTLLAATVESSASATSVTSASVSPSADALLIVAVKAVGDRAGSLAIASTTLSNVGSWTTVGPAYSGQNEAGTLLLAYAKVTGAPGSGTITATWTTGARAVIHVVEVTGHDTAAPVPQSKTGSSSSSDTTYSFTFDSAPVSTSAVVAAVAHRQATGITPGANFTELADQVASTNERLQTQFDLASASTTVDWSSLTAGNFRIGMAIEIAEAAAASTFVPKVVFL